MTFNKVVRRYYESFRDRMGITRVQLRRVKGWDLPTPKNPSIGVSVTCIGRNIGEVTRRHFWHRRTSQQLQKVIT